MSHHTGWAGNGSVTINLKEPEGIEVALELVSHCDVVIENFGPGVMERIGLGYDRLCEAKPDVVMFSMPAAGLYGPLSNLRTYGLSLASLTGLDSITGYEDGPPIAMENARSRIPTTGSWVRSRSSSPCVTAAGPVRVSTSTARSRKP
ncbi:MAG: CoA transferase [Microthrixaceae bacterium]|nr:CoA transferase [Microthrixaceae bacterium]